MNTFSCGGVISRFIPLGIWVASLLAIPAVRAQVPTFYHSSSGYVSPGSADIHCEIQYAGVPTDVLSLGLYPDLPPGVLMTNVTGDGMPEILGTGIVFQAGSFVFPLTFTYQVQIDPGFVSTLPVRNNFEYHIMGFEQTNAFATPDPLGIQPRVNLEIISDFGSTEPPLGLHSFTLNSIITNRILNPTIVNDRTQQQCMGWTMIGHNPPSGSNSVFTMSITNDAQLTWNWQTRYRIMPSASPGGYVTPSMPGWFAAGSNVFMQATPSNGYEFVEWTGELATNAQNFQLLIDRPYTLQALFQLQQFTVNAIAHTNGSVTPTGITNVNFGESLFYYFTPDQHYHVGSVFLDSVYLGETNSISLPNINSNHTIEVWFDPNQYSLLVTTPWGNPSPSGTTMHAYNSMVNAQMIGSPQTSLSTQRVCSGWNSTGTDISSGTGTTADITILTNATLNWLWDTYYQLTFLAHSNGAIQETEGWKLSGTNITLTAIPDPGYRFTQWSGDFTSTNNPLVFTMAQPRSVKPNFEPDVFFISASAGSGGSITPSGSVSVQAGGSTNFVFTPDPHYEVMNVNVNGQPLGPTNSFTFVNVQSNQSIFVSFVKMQYTFVVASDHGSPSPAVGTNSIVASNTVTCFISPEFITLGMTQYQAAGWSGTGSVPPTGTGTNFSFIITQPSSLTWLWDTYYQLTFLAHSNGSILETGGWKPAGTNITLTALPDGGWRFTGWTGDITSTNNPLSFPMNQAYSVKPNFEPSSYTIDAIAGAGGSITPSGMITVEAGGSTNFLIAPEASYHILNVLVDGTSVGAVSNYTFNNVLSNHIIQANFSMDDFNLDVISPVGTPLPAQGSHSFMGGTVVDCSVSPQMITGAFTQYIANGWIGSGSVPASGAGTNVSFTITNASSITWLWETQFYFDVTSPSGGYTTGEMPGFKGYAQTIVVTAVPYNGMTFSQWNGNVPASNIYDNPLTLIMDTARSIQPQFAPDTNLIFAIHASPGYMSPGAIAVTNEFHYPVGANLSSISCTPSLPPGWVLINASGDGGPYINLPNILFATTPTNNPVRFVYIAQVPGNQPLSNTLSAVINFNISAGASGAIPVSSNPLPVLRFHNADYRPPLCVIDNTEVNRILAYWRAGGYIRNVVGYDGYAPSATPNTNDTSELHSADYQIPRHIMDGVEVNSALALWRSGGYHVDGSYPGGYAPSNTTGHLRRSYRAAPLAASLQAPAHYDPGQTLTLAIQAKIPADSLSLYWKPELPDGWTLLSLAGNGAPETRRGESLWLSSIPEGDLPLSAQIAVPLNARGTQRISASFIHNPPDGSLPVQSSCGDILLTPRDDNANLLPDAWENHYNQYGLEPAADDDLDGLSNLAEYLAGTNPTDPSSNLRIQSIIPDAANGQITLTWDAIQGRSYTVRHTERLDPAARKTSSPLPQTPAPSGARVTLPDPSANTGFFWLELNQEAE